MAVQDFKVNDRKHVVFADSLHEATRFLEETPRKWLARFSQSSHDREWFGGSYENALKLARDGWPEGVASLAAAVRILPPQDKARSWSYDVAGDQPDVARYLGGELKHMRRRGHERKKKPVVCLAIQANASAGVSAAAMVQYGSVMVGLIDALEAAGRRVELYSVGASTLNGRTLVTGWKVKAADDVLDLSAVAFSIGHPSAFRRLHFALFEHSPREYEESSYGRPGTVTPEDCALIGAEDAIIMESVRDRIGISPTEALRKAKEALNAAAGEELVEV